MGVSKIVGGVLLILILISLLFMMWPFVRDMSEKRIDARDPFQGKTAVPQNCEAADPDGMLITLLNTGYELINMSPMSTAPFSAIKNLPQNSNFEKDANGDGIPDGWEVSNVTADIVLVTDLSISMQNCMDTSQPSGNCPADAFGRPINCTREAPCTNAGITDCSVWAANNEERYCNETTKYFETTYKKISNGPAGYWALDMVNFTNHTLDSSGNGNHGKLYGYNCNPARCNITGGQVNGSLKFDGVNDYVMVGNIPVNGTAGGKNTVTFWMNWSGQNNVMPFGWNTAYDLYLSGGCFGFNTGEGNILGISSAGLSGNWEYIAAVFYNGIPSAANNKLYINGVEQTLTNCRGSTTLSKTATTSAYISGWNSASTYKFKGAIDEFRIYNRSLSAEEISAEYSRGLDHLAGNCIIADSDTCSSPYDIKADTIPNISAGSQNYPTLACGMGYPYAYEYVFNNCEYKNGTDSSVCANTDGKNYSGNYNPPVNVTKAPGVLCSKGGFANECLNGECDVGNSSSICQFYDRITYGTELNCAAQTPSPGYVFNNGTNRLLPPYFNATCVAWAVPGAMNYSDCEYYNRTEYNTLLDCGTNYPPRIYNNQTPRLLAPYYSETCVAWANPTASNYSVCEGIPRTSCSTPACTINGPPYANGTPYNVSSYETSCGASECDGTSATDCDLFNRTSCNGAGTYNPLWHYRYSQNTTSFFQYLNCIVPPQCYLENNYTNCNYVNRTNANQNSCNAPANYNISKRYESGIWRTGATNPCLPSEELEETKNLYVCVEDTCGAGYENALPGDCNPGCSGGNACCKKQGMFNYKCSQYSDNCCEKDAEQCTQEQDYACEKKECRQTYDICCEKRDCVIQQDACCANRDQSCRVSQDACCTTSQKICQSREYQCCDRLTKCYPQETKCCEPSYQTCVQNTYAEVPLCSPEGYNNSAPDVLINGCSDTEKCDVERSCSYCENVAVRLAKKLDKNFTNTMMDVENRVGLVSYGTTAASDIAPTNIRNDVVQNISNYQANAGQTCISCALNKSIELLKNSPNPRFIVLMSDGAANMMINQTDIDSPGRYDETGIDAQNEARELACLANSTYGITIYTIGFGNAAGTNLLKSIANCTGGNFSQGSNAEELGEIYTRVAIEITGRLDDTVKVYGDNSMKIGGGQNYGAESVYVDIDPSFNYTFGNYLQLDVQTGDFYVILQLYNSAHSNIGNITLAQYSASILPPMAFRKENYTADLSLPLYAGVKYAKIFYVWRNAAATPAGTAWVDDVFFGPLVVCTAVTNKKYSCGDITIEKISGEGDPYPFTSTNLLNSYKKAYVKDTNCASDNCIYNICSPDICTIIECAK